MCRGAATLAAEARALLAIRLLCLRVTMRLVVKIGTSVISPQGQIDTQRIRSLVDQLDLTNHEYLIVSSGAIACGMTSLGIRQRPRTVAKMQACAAVGQSQLMHTYEQLLFGKKVVAQLLLSSDDFSSAVRHRNLRNTLRQLMSLGVVPIVNENDSVAVHELEGAFGDNDGLSAMLAAAVEADWLILLTDVEGFQRRNGRGSSPKLMRFVRRITPAIEAECNGRGRWGRGGMRSKLWAAQRATAAGIHVTIADGKRPDVISQVLQRRVGTYFQPQRRKAGHVAAAGVR